MDEWFLLRLYREQEKQIQKNFRRCGLAQDVV